MPKLRQSQTIVPERGSQRGAITTEFPPSFINRVQGGVRDFVRGIFPETWFTPGEPIAEVAPQEQPRRFAYPVGFNYVYTPRAYETISFWQLRALANNYDLLRTVIETRKDQISRLPNKYRVIPRPDEPPAHHAKRNREDPRLPLVESFFKRPDREHTFRAWQRMILDQMLVIDAASILPRWQLDGHLYGFDVIDGATIAPLIDRQGRLPIPPDPAYRQVIHGVPMRDLCGMQPSIISDQLMYCPRNPRPERVYGYSPVEQIIMTINIALRRQIHQLEYYTEGTIPDVFVELPEGWSEDQIREFELYFNSLMTGQTGERRKAKFLPGSSKVAWSKDWKLKDEMDDYLIRLVAYAFGVSPIALVKMVNRSSGTQMSDDAKMEGLEPIQLWFSEDVMNPIIQEYMGFKDIEHVFGEAIRSKPLEQAQIHAIYIDRKTLTNTEVRADLGRDPLTKEEITADEELYGTGPDQITAGTGAAGTKDKATSGGGGKPNGKSGPAVPVRGGHPSPRMTEADRGNKTKPNGRDAGE